MGVLVQCIQVVMGWGKMWSIFFRSWLVPSDLIDQCEQDGWLIWGCLIFSISKSPIKARSIRCSLCILYIWINKCSEASFFFFSRSIWDNYCMYVFPSDSTCGKCERSFWSSLLWSIISCSIKRGEKSTCCWWSSLLTVFPKSGFGRWWNTLVF